MRVRFILVLIASAFTVLLSGDGGALTRRARPDAAPAFQRIKFHIVAVEEKGAERIIISESTVEGPPNTDFNINLEGERFRMRARFLTDLIRPDALKVRAKLDTRRLYGYSERNLPLYEEDQQSQSLELGFDEAVVLLPFGRAGGDHRLKIEITPTLSRQEATLPAGKARPLEIDILRPSPGGILSFEASKNPHNFVVEAVLLEDGREVAGGTVPLLIEERGEMTLQPNSKAGPESAANPITINLIVERYAMSRPADQVTFAFDIYRTKLAEGTRRTSLARNWSGVASLDSNLTYDLNGQYLSTTGKKYEISFRFKLAPGEQTD